MLSGLSLRLEVIPAYLHLLTAPADVLAREPSDASAGKLYSGWQLECRRCAPGVACPLCPSPAASLVLTLQLCVQAAAGHRQAPEL